MHITFDTSKTFNTIVDGWNVSLLNYGDKPEGVNFLRIFSGEMEMECFPSKGLSIGQVWYKKEPIFWDAPIGPIPPHQFDPNQIDILINGKEAPGFSFIKTFASGIELYGLRNWGMPCEDENGKLLSLHGETSNIPVKKIEVGCDVDDLIISGEFTYRSFIDETERPWYERGDALYKVIRTIQLNKEGKLSVTDSIENISDKELIPDWGYHITFHARKDAKLIVPSKKIEGRSGGTLPPDIETWQPATRDSVRSEVGIIHKGLKPGIFNNKPANYALISYPNGKGISVFFTPSPYFQTWFCSGGANTREFTYCNGVPVFQKPWNGLGIEIGASALDHDGNTDKEVVYCPVLLPGEKKDIFIGIDVIANEKVSEIESDINHFNQKSRKKD